MTEAAADIEVEVEADAWLAALPDAVTVTQAAARLALGAPARDGVSARADLSLTVLLTDDAEVAGLNRQFRRKAGPTNVLSFPAHGTAIGHLGDLALAYETCALEAATQGKRLSDHLAHLVIHGVLHLSGWDHEADAEAEAMEDLERELLARLGVADPYASDTRA